MYEGSCRRCGRFWIYSFATVFVFACACGGAWYVAAEQYLSNDKIKTALSEGRFDDARYLLRLKPWAVNGACRGKWGNPSTLLGNCALTGNVEAAQFLLLQGADPNVWADDYHLPIANAISNGHDKVVDLLLAHGSEVDTGAIAYVAQYGDERNLSRLKKLLEARGTARWDRDTEPWVHSAIHFASQQPDSSPAIELLLAYGADVNQRSRSDEETPLHWAVQNAYLETSRTLLEAGADPNLQDHEGKTPLHTLLVDGYRQAHDDPVAALLLQYGADPRIKDSAGETAIDYARKWKATVLIKKLDVATEKLTQKEK